ncbi:MAG: tetratricopeptide repeat protein, partial [Cyanobacteriota bacterium]|nr:tetratricopeptide repeat protein [Cyanobacteriota bacterium]
PQSTPGEAVLVPTETSEITAIAEDEAATSLFPMELVCTSDDNGAVLPVSPSPLQLLERLPPQLRHIHHKPWLGPGLLGTIVVALALWQSGLTVAFEPSRRAVSPLLSTRIPTLATDLGRLLPPPEKAAYLVDRGNQLMTNGRYPEALAIYDEAIAVQADHAPAYLGRCRALIGLKRPSEAIAACNDALAYRSYYPEATRSKGNAEEQQGKLLAALSLYEETNRLMPALALAWLDRGRVLQKLGRSAEALTALNQAIALDRESAEAWTIRGEAAWALERYDQAIIAFDKALQVNPDHEPARLLRQQARQTLGR